MPEGTELQSRTPCRVTETLTHFHWTQDRCCTFPFHCTDLWILKQKLAFVLASREPQVMLSRCALSFRPRRKVKPRLQRFRLLCPKWRVTFTKCPSPFFQESSSDFAESALQDDLSLHSYDWGRESSSGPGHSVTRPVFLFFFFNLFILFWSITN